MEKLWLIYTHPVYQECLRKNKLSEEKRRFCIHNIQHFLDVARLAYILALEKGYTALGKEEIYAAAFLHDIGRWKQYEEGIPHEKASMQIADGILKESGFEEEKKNRILNSILEHRKAGEKQEELSEILHDADQMSRNCFACDMERECNWKEEKKNKRIIY